MEEEAIHSTSRRDEEQDDDDVRDFYAEVRAYTPADSLIDTPEASLPIEDLLLESARELGLGIGSGAASDATALVSRREDVDWGKRYAAAAERRAAGEEGSSMKTRCVDGIVVDAWDGDPTNFFDLRAYECGTVLDNFHSQKAVGTATSTTRTTVRRTQHVNGSNVDVTPIDSDAEVPGEAARTEVFGNQALLMKLMRCVHELENTRDLVGGGESYRCTNDMVLHMKDIATGLRLASVCSSWRAACHGVRELWRDVDLAHAEAAAALRCNTDGGGSSSETKKNGDVGSAIANQHNTQERGSTAAESHGCEHLQPQTNTADDVFMPASSLDVILRSVHSAQMNDGDGDGDGVRMNVVDHHHRMDEDSGAETAGAMWRQRFFERTLSALEAAANSSSSRRNASMRCFRVSTAFLEFFPRVVKRCLDAGRGGVCGPANESAGRMNAVSALIVVPGFVPIDGGGGPSASSGPVGDNVGLGATFPVPSFMSAAHASSIHAAAARLAPALVGGGTQGLTTGDLHVRFMDLLACAEATPSVTHLGFSGVAQITFCDSEGQNAESLCDALGAHWRNVEDLCLNNHGDDAMLKTLCAAFRRSLKKVSACHCRKLSLGCVAESVASCSDLDAVAVVGCHGDTVSSTAMAQALLLHKATLQSLDLSGSYGSDDDGTSWVTDSVMKSISRMELVSTISLARCRSFSADSLHVVCVNLPRLAVLDVSSCTQIAERELLSCLSVCENLKSLRVNYCTQLGDSFAAALSEKARCPRLERMAVYGLLFCLSDDALGMLVASKNVTIEGRVLYALTGVLETEDEAVPAKYRAVMSKEEEVKAISPTMTQTAGVPPGSEEDAAMYDDHEAAAFADALLT